MKNPFKRPKRRFKILGTPALCDRCGEVFFIEKLDDKWCDSCKATPRLSRQQARDARLMQALFETVDPVDESEEEDPDYGF